MKKNKLLGFTLAEVLITLTIIGVVAAMTIPTLMSKYQKHTYVVGLKKAYAQLKTAIQMVPITEGCSAGDYECAGWSNHQGASNQNLVLISKNLKFKEYCPYYYEQEKCKKYYDYFKNNIYNDQSHLTSLKTLVLDDGITIHGDYEKIFWVDVNGLKGPNKLGRDIFRFEFPTTEQNSIPAFTLLPVGSKQYSQYTGYDFHYWNNNGNPSCTNDIINSHTGSSPKQQATYCAGRVLEEDAMNY